MKCSKCGTEFESNFCPNCGAPANAHPIQNDVPKTTINPFWDKIVTCKTCGKQIARSAKTCPYCGARQHQGVLTACYLIVILMFVVIFYIILH
jgi:rubrerythrin